MTSFKKSQLEVFFSTLKGTEGVLSLAEARVRDTFLKDLTESVKTLEADRKVIYEKFCDKDEKGNPDITNDQFKFKNAVVEDLNNELALLYEEEVAFDVPETLKAIMEKTEYKPKTGEIAVIDSILELI